MLNWKHIIGKSFTPTDFDTYCHSLQWTAWRPSFLVLHNTAAPSLQDRPSGFTQQHMQDFVTYYRDTLHWSAGPHLFIDDRRIWVFTPLTTPGVHSPSWNKQSLGIEMLGNYAIEPFTTGRGLLVRQNTISVLTSLCSVLKIPPAALRLHKEDPATTHNCPGKNVIKQDIIKETEALILRNCNG
jgi:hypothetical protein